MLSNVDPERRNFIETRSRFLYQVARVHTRTHTHECTVDQGVRPSAADWGVAYRYLRWRAGRTAAP